MDEDEIRQQIEASRYYNFLREKRRQEQLAKMEAKEKEIEAEFQEQLVDLNQLKRTNTVQSSTGSENKESKKLSNSSKQRLAGGLIKHGTSIGSLLAKKTMTDEPKKSYVGAASMNRFMKKDNCSV